MGVSAGEAVCEPADWALVGEKMMAAGIEGKLCVCLCMAAK